MEIKNISFETRNGLDFAVLTFSDNSEVSILYARFQALEKYFENIVLDKFLDKKVRAPNENNI